MPPYLALFLSLGLSAFLLKDGRKEEPHPSAALWIPTTWVFILFSRSISAWFNIQSTATTIETFSEGSPIDRFFFSAMMILGAVVLGTRHLDWGSVLRKNVPLLVFIFYCLISTIWSDFFAISLKRWVKFLGDFIMVLVIFTEERPIDALKKVFTRCAAIVLPLSIVYIKYFPKLGRWYSPSGGVDYHGVGYNKNIFGCVCMILAIFFIWRVLDILLRRKEIGFRTMELLRPVLFLVLAFWNLTIANSATSMLCLIVASTIMLSLSIPLVSKNTRFIGAIVFSTVIVVLLLQFVFRVDQILVASLGRDMTLTGRTELWGEVLAFKIDPLLGTGFESFWLGDRYAYFYEKYYFHPNQAHSGYIDLYINLGILGIIFLSIVLLKAYRNTMGEIERNFSFGRYRIAFFAIVLIYNITEAAFKGLHPMWFSFLLLAGLERPNLKRRDTSTVVTENPYVSG